MSIKNMIVVCHEAVCVADPAVAFIDMLESVQKGIAVLVVLENRPFLRRKRLSPKLLPIDGEEFKGGGDYQATAVHQLFMIVVNRIYG